MERDYGRETDRRIAAIHEDVQEIISVIKGTEGLCVRMSVAEKGICSVQNEITDHKADHKWGVGQAIVVASIVASLVGSAFMFIKH